MKFDDWFIAQFRDVLSEPLAETDGVPDSEIDAALEGSSLPSSVRAYFRVAGKHWLNTNYNEWLPLGAFETIGDSEPLEWYSEEKPFSQFIIAMWQWLLTGDDPA